MKTINILDSFIYWLIILIPFFIGIAPAPMNSFIGLLIFFFVIKKIITKKPFYPDSKVILPLLIFFTITCLSIFRSEFPIDTLKGGISRLLLFIFLFFSVSLEIKDKKHMQLIVISVIAGLILVSSDAIWQIITGYDFIRGYEKVSVIGLERATSSFSDPNTLGIYLSGFIPILLALFLYYLKGRMKIIFGIFSFIAIAGSALTYSRPTLLAIYLVLLFFGIIKKDKLLIGIILLFTILSPLLAPPPVKDWAKEVDYNPIRFMCNDDRIAIFINSARMIKAHPFLGMGANTFMKNYQKYKYPPQYRDAWTTDYIYAHNNFLQMAPEVGLIGLGVFIWFLISLFIELKRIYFAVSDEFLKILFLSLTGCLIAFLINGLTESSLYSSRVAPVFWYLVGFCLSFKRLIYADKAR